MAFVCPPESILDAIGAALGAISTAAGYNTDPSSVARWDGDSMAITPPEIIYRWTALPLQGEGGAARSAWSARLEVEVLYYAPIATGLAGVSLDEWHLRAAEDVWRSLSEVVSWTSLDAVLDLIEVAPFVELDETERFDGVGTTLSIQYRVSQEDTKQKLVML